MQSASGVWPRRAGSVAESLRVAINCGGADFDYVQVRRILPHWLGSVDLLSEALELAWVWSYF
jgi:hypothetical protein